MEDKKHVLFRENGKYVVEQRKHSYTYPDWSVQVGLFNTQHNLPGNRDAIEEVVDEAHVVDEGVHVAGAEHEQGGQALRNRTRRGSETGSLEACLQLLDYLDETTL